MAASTTDDVTSCDWPLHIYNSLKEAGVSQLCYVPDEIGDLESVAALRRKLQNFDGPHFARIHISSVHVERALPPRDGVFLKNRFREHLGFPVN
jgi:hypothetical protein